MKIYNYTISLQEVPDEISLCIGVVGCDLACIGCHSSEYRMGSDLGFSFSIHDMATLIDKYASLISCVTFFGGEWEDDFIYYLDIINSHNINSCLYTGRDYVNASIIERLTYIKLGEYKHELGAISSNNTNQRLIDLRNNEDITFKFKRV